MWTIDVILQSAPGLTLWIFDRSCRYTAAYGGVSDSRAQRGVLVGENLSRTDSVRALEAAQRAITEQAVTTFDVEYLGRMFELRIAPVRTPLFGVVGGVICGWDVTDRLLAKLAQREPGEPKEA